MPVLVDTTVVIDALRGRAGAIERMRARARTGDIPYVSVVSIEEVARGIRADEVAAANRLFDALRIVPAARDVAWLAGSWRGELARRGITIAQADCLIAASAHAAGAALATGNPKHFPVEGLVVEHWPVGA